MKGARHWQFLRTVRAGLALLLVCTAGLPQPGAAAAKTGAPPVATQLLHLSAVKLEDSGWTDKRVLDVVRGAGRMLAQCGVQLGRVALVSLVVAPGQLDLATPVASEITRDHPVARPAVYFVRDTRRNPPFEAEAFGRANTRTRPELAGTVWITHSARDPAIALAHELAHVLMDSGEHSDEPGNLMRDETTPKNTRLTAGQCARLRDTAASNGLLKQVE